MAKEIKPMTNDDAVARERKRIIEKAREMIRYYSDPESDCVSNQACAAALSDLIVLILDPRKKFTGDKESGLF